MTTKEFLNRMLRAIREIKPPWIVGENVSGIVNWNGGMVFEEVQTDLEAEGYEVQAYLLPAASKNAPHKRERVWFVAYSQKCANLRKSRSVSEARQKKRLQKRHKIQFTKQPTCLQSGMERTAPNAHLCRNNPNQRQANNILEWQQSKSTHQQWHKWTGQISGYDDEQPFAHSQGFRRRRLFHAIQKKRAQKCHELFGCKLRIHNGNAAHPHHQRCRQNNRIGETRQHYKKASFSYWTDFPTQSPVLLRNDGLSPQLDGITFSKWRNETIKAAGNAIVPQVALSIFQAIEKYQKQ